MIVHLLFILISGVLGILTVPLTWIPGFPVGPELPWGIDSIFVMAVSTFKAVMTLFPPFEVVYNAAKLYLGFELIMFVLRFIIGHRLKDHPLD